MHWSTLNSHSSELLLEKSSLVFPEIAFHNVLAICRCYEKYVQACVWSGHGKNERMESLTLCPSCVCITSAL